MNKVSIIIPIYNSSKYLKMCLNSIINQTYKNLEIILINDGSTDNSLDIMKEYKNNDNRIVIIDKKNTGVADTRNKGIEKATGKYIMFVDSDDIITNNYVEDMVITLEKDNADIVTSSMIIRTNKDEIISLNKQINGVSINEILPEIINTIHFSSSCKTLIKKDIIEDVHFNTNLKYGEDMLFSYNILKKSKISYLDNKGYIYIQHNESAIHNYNYESIKKYLDDTMYVLNTILDDYKEKYTLINNRKLSKINLALLRLSINKTIKYKEYKKIIKQFICLCEIENINIKNISNESKINRIRLYLLKNKHYCIYYRLNKIINFIKRK